MAEPTLDAPQLLRRLASSRDGEAWAELVERFGDGIFAVTLRILRDPALAEDASQETLLQLREHAGKFVLPPDASNPDECVRRWIVRIAANTALLLLRKRRLREREVRMTPPTHVPAAPDESAQRSETLDRIQTEIASLPEVLRAAVVLRFYGNLDFAELAAELRCPLGTAKARVSRGIEKLRERAAAGGVVLSLIALEGLLDASAHPAAAAAVADAARMASWKKLIESKRAPSLNGLPAKGMSLMAKISLLGAGTLLVAAVLSTQWKRHTADAPAGTSLVAETPAVTPPVVAADIEKPKPPVAEPKADAPAKNADVVKFPADSREALEQAVRDIASGKQAPSGLLVAVTRDNPKGQPVIVSDQGGTLMLNSGAAVRKLSQDEFRAFLKTVIADVADLPDARTALAEDLRKGRFSIFLNGASTTVTVTTAWKNGDAFWKATHDLVAAGDTGPGNNTALADSLKAIAAGTQPLATLRCSAQFPVREMTLPIKIGDQGPTVHVNVRGSTVQIGWSVVVALRPIETQGHSAAIPDFDTKSRTIAVTDAELRQLAGLLADAGVQARLRGFSWVSNERRLRLDIDVDAQSGSISADLNDEKEAKRVEKLLALLKDFSQRPEKE